MIADNGRYVGFKNAFAGAASIRMQVKIDSVNISEDFAKATVTGLFLQHYTPKGKKTGPTIIDQSVIQLAKSNGNWVITDVR